jgi:hypothetical protein
MLSAVELGVLDVLLLAKAFALSLAFIATSSFFLVSDLF